MVLHSGSNIERRHKMPEQLGPWDVSSGMIDDVDAYLANSHFGVQTEYAAIAGADQLCFIGDLVNPENEIIGKVVFSVGAGWKTADGGASIYHDARQNVVKSSRYGEFLMTVVQKLGVDMSQYGESALVASSFDNLGFHWNLQKMKTVGGDEKDVLMPTSFLGVLTEEPAEEATPAVAAAAVKAPVAKAPAAAKPALKAAAKPAGKKPGLTIDPNLDAQLSAMAKAMDLGAFQKAALKLGGVTDNPPLLSSILSEGDNSYYNTHKE